MSSSSYTHEKSIPAFSWTANQWLSQIRFAIQEARFLELLIERYLKWLAQGEHADQVITLSSRCKTCLEQADLLVLSVENHLRLLATLAREEGKLDASWLKKQVDLENDVIGFGRSLNGLKTRIFELTEAVSRQEKVRSLDRLLSSRA